MYTSYYGMSVNPFLKSENIKYKFESKDFKETINRLNYIKEIKGVCLITGHTGYGKTFSIRYFINELSQDLYKVIYISATNEMTVFDFYKALCDQLYLDTGACYRAEIYQKIQNEFKRLVKKERVQPIVIIDDAHVLKREIINNFKVFYDFDMDSTDYISLIIVGQVELKDILMKNIFESLKQRIIVNYTFNGFSREEVCEYVKSRLKIADTNQDIFEVDALNALYACSKASPRRLNTLIINSLMLGHQNEKIKIDSSIIIDAKKEMDLLN